MSEHPDSILRLCEILGKLPAEERAEVWEYIALAVAAGLLRHEKDATDAG